MFPPKTSEAALRQQDGSKKEKRKKDGESTLVLYHIRQNVASVNSEKDGKR